MIRARKFYMPHRQSYTSIRPQMMSLGLMATLDIVDDLYELRDIVDIFGTPIHKFGPFITMFGYSIFIEYDNVKFEFTDLYCIPRLIALRVINTIENKKQNIDIDIVYKFIKILLREIKGEN